MHVIEGLNLFHCDFNLERNPLFKQKKLFVVSQSTPATRMEFVDESSFFNSLVHAECDG